MVIFCKCITYPISTGKWTNGLEATEAHTSKEGQDHEEQHNYGEDGQGLLWTCDRHTVFIIKYILKPGFTVLYVFFFSPKWECSQKHESDTEAAQHMCYKCLDDGKVITLCQSEPNCTVSLGKITWWPELRWSSLTNPQTRKGLSNCSDGGYVSRLMDFWQATVEV